MDISLGWKPFFMQQLTLDELETCVPTRVIALHRSGLVVSDGAREDNITLGGAWFRLPSEERPTVGDWVLVNRERDRVERLLERTSCFRRVAAGLRVDVQLIAANVDTLFVVTSCNDEFNASRLERYLALALEAGVTPVIVLTKADLADDPESYRANAQGLAGDAGSSGVGKSTLLKTLAGSEVQHTRAIREDDARGRHTTTSRLLHRLANGGLLLDVPGMRELAIGDAEAGVREAFDDIEQLAEGCRFAARCSKADDICHGEPALAEVGNGHSVACWMAEGYPNVPNPESISYR